MQYFMCLIVLDNCKPQMLSSFPKTFNTCYHLPMWIVWLSLSMYDIIPVGTASKCELVEFVKINMIGSFGESYMTQYSKIPQCNFSCEYQFFVV